MHSLLFITCNRDRAETSEEARGYVYETLAADESFAGDGGRFSSPVADWFVIGGRWSGELSRLTWAKELTKTIEEMEKQAGVQVWGAFYGSNEEAKEKQKHLAEEIEALYRKALPQEFCGKGLVYNRDMDRGYGYECTSPGRFAALNQR